ncbi:MAG: dTMP kinase [Burkholderiales bacterium]|jgi:dTMP kinase|nr:dTMP kinase [Burkholderiales bacterium]
MKGRFITFEGIDGAGKSTHLEALATWLRGKGADVLCTREPGGTSLAEQLRALFLSEPMDPLTEALLVFAARRDHLRQMILPALARGSTVLCDRFSDATFAYQGAGRGFSVQTLKQLEEWVQEGLQPDLTFWFDVAPEVAARRRALARNADRMERMDDAFFARVRSGYRIRAESYPARFVRIDAEEDIQTVAQVMIAALDTHLW